MNLLGVIEIAAVLSVIFFAIFSVVVSIRARRAKRGHDEQDSNCVYWTGDRAGYNLRAVCPKCKGVS